LTNTQRKQLTTLAPEAAKPTAIVIADKPLAESSGAPTDKPAEKSADRPAVESTEERSTEEKPSPPVVKPMGEQPPRLNSYGGRRRDDFRGGAPREGSLGRPGPGPNTRYVASQPPRAADAGPPSADSPADAPAPRRPPIAKKSPDGLIHFDFRYTPWDYVLDWFAQQADLSLVAPAPPAGTFNYTDTSRGYTPNQAIDLLNSVLLTKGYVLVKREKMLMLIRSDEIPPNLVPVVKAEDLAKLGEFDLVYVSARRAKSRFCPRPASCKSARRPAA
jgi:hypothetical protein